nr:MAG TPA: DNA directed DNA polymerase [Caudoviricetes sp.]
MNKESTFLYHEPCPKCGSSDACGVFSDGHRFCYSCNTYFRPDGSVKTDGSVKSEVVRVSKDCIPLGDLEEVSLTKRCISKDTCSKFKYFSTVYKGKPCQVACYYDDSGNLVGQKLRFPDKSFAVLGSISNRLYGSQLWASGKKIVITEGEIDCLTVSQLQGNKWPVVSIPNGAQGAKKAIEANLEYLGNFEEVILMFDMDDPGRKASEECAKILPAGKAYIANLPCKDPNECLSEGKGPEVLQAVWNAKPYRPDGIVSGTDLYEKCVTDIDDLKDSVEYPWVALQNKTKGARHGELYVFTSGSGMGKSTILRELEYYFGVQRGELCGIVALEESTRKTGLELMSIHLNKRLILDPEGADEDERGRAFNETIGNGKFFLYDHFGSLDSGNLLSKLRYMIVSLGCKRIFLDHISIVVSGMDADEDGGERKAIDKLMTNLRSLVEETGATMFVVSHLKRPEKKGHEEGAQVSLSQLRGSGAIAQLSDMVIGLERNQQGDNPNVLTLRVLKNRFCGDTGISGYLEYDPETGRLKDCPQGSEDCPFESEF